MKFGNFKNYEKIFKTAVRYCSEAESRFFENRNLSAFSICKNFTKVAHQTLCR